MADYRKVFVAIPSQADSVKINTMLCVLDSMVDALTQDIALEVHGYAGINPISSCRNVILAEFLKSDCDDLVQLDDDLAWGKGALVRLLKHDVDFVFGAYPYRGDVDGFPIRWLPNRQFLFADAKTGLLEVEGGGFGFARVTRRCVEKMVKAYGDLEYPEGAAPGGKTWRLFQLDTMVNGIPYSEDMLFAKRWRDIGGQVWVDPEIGFLHIGNKGFAGHLGTWLRTRIQREAKETNIVEEIVGLTDDLAKLTELTTLQPAQSAA